MSLAMIRESFSSAGLSVPIGDDFNYSGREPLPYRWEDGDVFQVFFLGVWLIAESIDWRLIN